MKIEFSEEQMQQVLGDIVKHGFSHAFESWDFKNTVNREVAEFVAEEKIAVKIGDEVRQLLEGQSDKIIKEAVGGMLPVFSEVFRMAVEQMVNRMLIGSMLPVDIKDSIYKDELKVAIDKVAALREGGNNV